MSAYRPYPKYKPSGVEWLGDVPEGWKVSRIKNVATINASKSEVSHLDPKTEISFLPMEAVGDDGSLDTSTTRPLGDVLTGYTYVRENDVLVAKITPCFENGKGCIARGLNNGIGFATTEVVPIRPNKRSIPEFLYFLLHGLPFRKVAEGSMYGAGGQKRVSDTFVAGYAFALPPLPEQHHIAAFLDRECGKLDALQAKQERLIELLKEKRQALISHAVTKGLDPTAKLKPSGIEWLGEVPECWMVSKVKWVSVSVKTGGTPSDPSWFTDEPEVPWLTPGDFSDECFKMSARRFVTQEGIAKREAPLFPPSSVFVVGIGATLGKVARLEQRQPASSNQQINAIVPSRKIESDYLLYSLLAQTEQMKNCSNASTLGIMNQEKTKGINIVLPPLAEQRAIVAHLDEKCGKIDQLKAKAERGIELLKERRSALISAAVTGKIDVRHT
jgi:type I restriction enzyme, S subunit